MDDKTKAPGVILPADALTAYIGSLWDKAEEVVIDPDILVTLDSKSFVGCNKIVLGAFSEYFDELFAKKEMRHCTEFPVPKTFTETLGSRSLRVFEKCLEWIHTGNVDPVKKDVKEMYKAAAILKIPKLVQICKDLWPEV